MNCTNDPIIIRAKFMAQHLNVRNVRGATLLILYDLRVPVHYMGFDYLLIGIPSALESTSQIVANEIYEYVGSQYIPKVVTQNMEGAIRDAIKAAWKNRTDENWNYYFPDYMVCRRKQPSNLEFISAIVYFLKLWQDCCTEGANYANV